MLNMDSTSASSAQPSSDDDNIDIEKHIKEMEEEIASAEQVKSDGKPKWDATPAKHGLYDPRFEIGECGVGAIVNLCGTATNQVRDQNLKSN